VQLAKEHQSTLQHVMIHVNEEDDATLEMYELFRRLPLASLRWKSDKKQIGIRVDDKGGLNG
jgi:hypothetical protein